MTARTLTASLESSMNEGVKKVLTANPSLKQNELEDASRKILSAFNSNSTSNMLAAETATACTCNTPQTKQKRSAAYEAAAAIRDAVIASSPLNPVTIAGAWAAYAVACAIADSTICD